MNRKEFIHFLKIPYGELQNNKKVCFLGAVYPLLFFTDYFAQLKKKGAYIQAIDLQTMAYADVIALLEMPLFGNTMTYWLKDMSVLSDAILQKYISYIQTYSGPHTIYFFLQEQVTLKEGIVVEIPSLIKEAEYRIFHELFYGESSGGDTLTKIIFAENQAISCEAALILLRYQQVVGRGFKSFVGWLPRIITPEKSLFILSQYFFARNYSQFTKEWISIRQQYPDEFWIVYWSEQIWQALIFLTAAQKGEISQVKSKVFRLPFSFMNKDWKSIEESELVRAHQFLYSVDYGIKNGYASDGIDLLVNKFLLKQFQEKELL